MPIMVRRTLFRVGEGSYAVTLPKSWISYKQLKHGDMVEITAGEDIVIRAAETDESDTDNVSTSVIT